MFQILHCLESFSHHCMQQDLFHKYVLFNMYYLFINICGVATMGPDAVLSAGDKMVSKASPVRLSRLTVQ